MGIFAGRPAPTTLVKPLPPEGSNKTSSEAQRRAQGFQTSGASTILTSALGLSDMSANKPSLLGT